MRATLALAALVRHRARTLLAVLGVAVSAAMLLDMVMLASGMRESFRGCCWCSGFQLRLSPKGTLPFDTEATIDGAATLVAAVRAQPGVEAVSPVLGGQLHVLPAGTDSATDVGTAPPRTVAFALGIQPAVQGDYELVSGANVRAPTSSWRTTPSSARSGARVGDTLDVAAGFDPQLRAYAGRRRMAVVGRARFFYTPGEQAVVALPLATLQTMRGAEGRDRVSLVMAQVRDGTDVEVVRAHAGARGAARDRDLHRDGARAGRASGSATSASSPSSSARSASSSASCS